jgi:hypothetical protein
MGGKAPLLIPFGIYSRLRRDAPRFKKNKNAAISTTVNQFLKDRKYKN